MDQSYPFKNVIADYDIDGNTEIMWELEPGFDPEGPLTFTVQWARDGSDSWEDVDTVEDTFIATDTTSRIVSALRQGYYRVVLEDGNGDTYQSDISNLHAGWESSDIQIISEIRRREKVMYEKSGEKLLILFRRHWGEECSTCVNPTTGESRSSRCEDCYGTGITGGYWPAHETMGLPQGSQQKIVQQLGTMVQEQMMVRMSPVPLPTKYDIIVEPNTDQRYKVTGVEQKATWKSRPIVIHLQLDLFDPSHVAYEVPLS